MALDSSQNVAKCGMSLPLPSAGSDCDDTEVTDDQMDHYQRNLSAWRFNIRKFLLPIVRRETPILAALQGRLRCSAFDTFFAVSANLGTHTFFMLFLPIMFWCGHAAIARATVSMLALGVFLSGVLKDMLCLPRPLSPPLSRITMSQHVSLEYGFPSTHSTNALSIATYFSLILSKKSELSSTFVDVGQLMIILYAITIVLGRLYCGMHGFLDVISGSMLGISIALLQFHHGQMLDECFIRGSLSQITAITLLILLMVRLHPEPVDDCPCFDDSVAFAGVVIGVNIGAWRFWRSDLKTDTPSLASIPFDLVSIGWTRGALRIVIGVALIVSWREIMKPTMFKILPPIFRLANRLGLNFPRRYFLLARNYRHVPIDLRDDTVLPSVTELPVLLTNLRHPRRSRSVSIGPQSASDAYEALAFNERQRSNSIKSMNSTLQRASNSSINEASELCSPCYKVLHKPASSQIQNSTDQAIEKNGHLRLRARAGSKSTFNEKNLEEAVNVYDSEKKKIFSKLVKVRVRYDIEVVTKLVVYSGIGWLVMEGIPRLFVLLNLSV